ncbi:protein of unknown function [uncultured Sphingopyxis sp.]|uniref:Uncharacterized protein n=1 Tax=uncultured Sphingopyxis sp. TaxID=310581 RepID=A0A1Y5PUR6_9SPHN|nr:protein of unknown function [uncultured Sphingopyxis sp.]
MPSLYHIVRPPAVTTLSQDERGPNGSIVSSDSAALLHFAYSYRKPLRLPRHEESPQETRILSNKNSKTCPLAYDFGILHFELTKCDSSKMDA